MSENAEAKGSSYLLQGIITRQLISMHRDVQRISKVIVAEQISPNEALVQLESMAAFLHIAIGAARAAQSMAWEEGE